MRILINIFLLLFLADGSVSLLDELLTSLLQITLLDNVRAVVAWVTVFAALVVYITMGIDRRLPKRVLLPLCLFVFWGAMILWPLPKIFSRMTFGLVGTGLQFALGVAALLFIRKINGRSLLMTARMFKPPVFRLRNTLFFTGANVVMVPLALIVFGLVSLSDYISQQTAGFVRLGFDGLYMTEKIYRHNGKQIRLAGMIHIGDKTYYEDIVASINSPRTVVLAEGISDRHRLLTYRFDHRKFADLLGVATQAEMTIEGDFVDLENLTAGEITADTSSKPHIVMADMDVSQFDSKTIELLNLMGQYVNNDATLFEDFKSYSQWVDANLTDEVTRTLKHDILTRRNGEVIRRLHQALPLYDTIVIPWGALHMVEIEAAVTAQGFNLDTLTERLSIDFGKIKITELLQRIIAESGRT